MLNQLLNLTIRCHGFIQHSLRFYNPNLPMQEETSKTGWLWYATLIVSIPIHRIGKKGISVLLQQHNHLQCQVEEHHLGIDVLLDMTLGLTQLVHDTEDVLLVHEGGET